jgi:hypothetical protein
LELLRQEWGGGTQESTDTFWQEESNDDVNENGDEEELILPTDVPRDKAAEKRLYRELAKRFHPDLGKTTVETAYRTEMMSAVNTAYSGGDVQSLYDLAGELDPAESAWLSQIPSKQMRRLRHQILRCQQGRRKARRRLNTLRQENTARLWKKALRLDSEDTHWWEVVRQEIEMAIERLQKEVNQLKILMEASENTGEMTTTSE